MPRSFCAALMASCFAAHAHGGYISPRKSTTKSPFRTPFGSAQVTPKPLRCTTNISGAARASAASAHSAFAPARANARVSRSFSMSPSRSSVDALSSAASAKLCVAAVSMGKNPYDAFTCVMSASHRRHKASSSHSGHTRLNV